MSLKIEDLKVGDVLESEAFGEVEVMFIGKEKVFTTDEDGYEDTWSEKLLNTCFTKKPRTEIVEIERFVNVYIDCMFAHPTRSDANRYIRKGRIACEHVAFKYEKNLETGEYRRVE